MDFVLCREDLNALKKKRQQLHVLLNVCLHLSSMVTNLNQKLSSAIKAIHLARKP